MGEVPLYAKEKLVGAREWSGYILLG